MSEAPVVRGVMEQQSSIHEYLAAFRRRKWLLLVMKIGEVTRPMVRDALEFMRPLPCCKLGIVVTNVPLEGGWYRYRYYREKAAEANVAPSAGQA